MSVNLGRVAYVEKGAYDNGIVYQKKDVVSFNGGSFVFIADTPAAGIVPTDTAYWQPMLDPTSMIQAVATANQAAETANQAANAANAAAEAADEAASSAENALAAVEETLSSIQEDYTELAGEVSRISEEMAEPITPERMTCFKQPKNIFTGWANDGYYVSQLDGRLSANAAHVASDYIAVKPNTSYVFSTENGGTYSDVRFALYDANKAFISGGVKQPQFDTPENAEYVMISITRGIAVNPQLEIGTEATEYEEPINPHLKYEYISIRNPYNPKPQIERKAYTTTDAYPVRRLDAYPNSIKQNRVINLYFATGSFNRVIIDLKNTSGTNIVEVTVNATQVLVSNYLWGTPSEQTYDHGLTITDHLGVRLVVSMDSCELTVSSAGNTFEKTWLSLNRGLTYPFVQIAAATGTTLLSSSWTCTDFDKQVWVYGDSYIQNDNTRWMYHLIKDGYNKNCLIDGYSGASSNHSIVSLKNTIALGYVPKYIFWCMGMNDGTDSGDTPSAIWMTNIEKLMAICEDYNIRPVLATIPSVPGINHEAKNAWVRASGHQYVDFAHAVNATPDGVWLDGMLSSDNVHPAAPGGLALYHRVLSDFPQIMIG